MIEFGREIYLFHLKLYAFIEDLHSLLINYESKGINEDLLK